jgi:hypothetical protein
MAMANTLAYYDTARIMAVKVFFIEQALGAFLQQCSKASPINIKTVIFQAKM